MVEEVEEITAKLGARGPTRFCSGKRARRRRRSVRNGEATAASVLRAVEAKECKWSRRVHRAGAGFHQELGRATWRRWPNMRATRRSAPEPVGHGELCPISETLIQCSTTTPDSATSTIRNSQTVAIWFMV